MPTVKPTYTETGDTTNKIKTPSVTNAVGNPNQKVTVTSAVGNPNQQATVTNLNNTNNTTKAPEVINDKTMAEIQRKAYAGEQMLSPTEAKMKAYNNFLAQKQKEDLAKTAGANRDAFVENQGAMLGQARDQQLSDIQKQLADAVTEGTISVRDAQAQFEQQKASIEQQAYQDSQVTNLTAEDRGIGNSQQLLGLQAGDNARKNSMINQNMTTRDRRINDISDRINNIKNKGNIDITQANANYGYGMASAKAQADMQYNQNMYGMQLNDYQASRDQRYTQENMATQQQYTQDNMRTQQNYDLAKMSVQQTNVLAQMAKQQGYDLAKMSQAQVNDLAKMATQQGYNMDLQNDAQAHDVTMMNAQGQWDMQKIGAQIAGQIKVAGVEQAGAMSRLDKEMKAKQQEYLIERERALRGVTPGTPEYDIAMGQINMKQQAEFNSWMNEQISKGEFKGTFLDEKGNFNVLKEPTKPTKPNVTPQTSGGVRALKEYDAKMKQYDADMEAWKAQQRYLQKN